MRDHDLRRVPLCWTRGVQDGSGAALLRASEGSARGACVLRYSAGPGASALAGDQRQQRCGQILPDERRTAAADRARLALAANGLRALAAHRPADAWGGPRWHARRGVGAVFPRGSAGACGDGNDPIAALGRRAGPHRLATRAQARGHRLPSRCGFSSRNCSRLPTSRSASASIGCLQRRWRTSTARSSC